MWLLTWDTDTVLNSTSIINNDKGSKTSGKGKLLIFITSVFLLTQRYKYLLYWHSLNLMPVMVTNKREGIS